MPRIPPAQRSPYPGDAASALDVWLSFEDLKRAGIVSSRKTLGEWQRDPRIGFPPGKLFAPKPRRWSKRYDIDPWLQSRPLARDAFDDAELRGETGEAAR